MKVQIKNHKKGKADGECEIEEKTHRETHLILKIFFFPPKVASVVMLGNRFLKIRNNFFFF